MSETTLWRFVTAALFTTAVAIGVMTASPVAVVITLVTWLSWLTMTDATREQVATLRRRTVVALARLRRRHDDELMELWCDVKGKPVAEYVPEGAWAPAEREQPTIFDVGHAMKLAADHQQKLDDVTEPIPVCPPTVPDMKAAAKVGPLPSVDHWQAEMDAQYEAALAKIRGGL